MKRAYSYAEDIVSKKLLACEGEYLACKRFLEDLEREDFRYVFDESRAQHIIDFFERYCRHVKGIFEGELIQLLPFQVFDLANIFGWVNKETGARRFTRSFIEEARGNAKSAIMSGICCYGMTSDVMYPPGQKELARYERNPYVACAAVDREQATIVHGDACDMAFASPEIINRLTIKKSFVEHKTRKGQMVKFSKDTKNKDGKSVTIAVCDEIHAWTTDQVLKVITSGFGKRPQNLLCIITTAGEDAENSIGKKEHDTAMMILNGKVKGNAADRYFAMIRQMDPNDDIHDETNWVKANPMLRYDNEYTAILREEIRNAHDLAYGTGDTAAITEWLIKRGCLWQVDSLDSYMGMYMDDWRKAAIPKDEFFKIVRGQECWVGLDMSKALDLVGLSFIWFIKDKLYIYSHGFVPDLARHEKLDDQPYRIWRDQGWLSEIQGKLVDDKDVIEFLLSFREEHNLKYKEVVYDPYESRQLINDLAKKHRLTCIELIQQYAQLSDPSKKFREYVIKGDIVHCGSPLFEKHIANAMESKKENHIKVQKENKDSTKRIDLLAATHNAFSRAYLKLENKSVYEIRGIRGV